MSSKQKPSASVNIQNWNKSERSLSPVISIKCKGEFREPNWINKEKLLRILLGANNNFTGKES